MNISPPPTGGKGTGVVTRGLQSTARKLHIYIHNVIVELRGHTRNVRARYAIPSLFGRTTALPERVTYARVSSDCGVRVVCAPPGSVDGVSPFMGLPLKDILGGPVTLISLNCGTNGGALGLSGFLPGNFLVATVVSSSITAGRQLFQCCTSNRG